MKRAHSWASCPRHSALAMAQERGSTSSKSPRWHQPPVVKFLDFGQYKYELTKREKENKRRQRSVTFKEVRLSPKIGSGDFETKVHRAIEFLEDGDRIKVTVRFRGRELTHPELGRNLLARFAERVKEHGIAERAPLLEGKSMHITMASTHKPKDHEAAAPSAADRRTSSRAGTSGPTVAGGSGRRTGRRQRRRAAIEARRASRRPEDARANRRPRGRHRTRSRHPAAATGE